MRRSFSSVMPPADSTSRLPLPLNPLRLAASASPWRAAWYLIGYLVVGSLLAAIAFGAASTATSFAAVVVGLPLLIAMARVVRWCADVERHRLRQVYTEPVRGEYPPVTASGVLERALAPWRQRVLWRDLGYLAGLWVPLEVKMMRPLAAMCGSRRRARR